MPAQVLCFANTDAGMTMWVPERYSHHLQFDLFYATRAKLSPEFDIFVSYRLDRRAPW
jgi:hypothetical protein